MDGTNIPIEYSCRPIDPKWFSHKLNWTAAKYKMVLSLKTDWRVWINILCPTEQHNGKSITKQSLIHCSHKKNYIADGA